MTATTDPELQAAAAEELAQAVRLKWAELARLVPYGDTYEGYGPAGGAIEFERSYIWRDAPDDEKALLHNLGGPLFGLDRGARVSQVIPKPG